MFRTSRSASRSAWLQRRRARMEGKQGQPLGKADAADLVMPARLERRGPEAHH